MHLLNPNLGSNSGMQIFAPRILGPNSGVIFCCPMFSSKNNPPQKITLKKFAAQKSHQKIHPRTRAEKFTLQFCRAILLTVCTNNFGTVCRNRPSSPLKRSRKQAEGVCTNCLCKLFSFGWAAVWVGCFPITNCRIHGFSLMVAQQLCAL